MTATSATQPRVSEAHILLDTLVRLNAIPGALFVRRNVGRARSSTGALVRFGLPGMADIHGIANGLAIEVETKSSTGRQTRAQRAWQIAVERAGGVYILARSADEAVTAVQRVISGRVTPS